MAGIEYTSLDDDLLLAGLDGYVKPQSSGNRIYRLKQGTTTVQFLTNPWTRNEDFGWFIYREVSAFDGLRGGFELPNGLKEFPVNDQIVQVVDGERRRFNAPRGTDPLLELVQPSSKYPPADGRAKGSDKLAVNILNEDGEHIILKMSGARGADLLRAFNGYRELDPSFDCTKFPWQLTLAGAGASASLTVRPLKNEPPMDAPEPFNLKKEMDGIRERVERFVDSLRGDQHEAVPADEDDIVDAFEAAVVEDDLNTDPRDLYSSMSDARLKTLLTKNGVAVPPRSTRPALIELAVANL